MWVLVCSGYMEMMHWTTLWEHLLNSCSVCHKVTCWWVRIISLTYLLSPPVLTYGELLGIVYKVQCLKKRKSLTIFHRRPPSPLKGNSRNIENFLDTLQIQLEQNSMSSDDNKKSIFYWNFKSIIRLLKLYLKKKNQCLPGYEWGFKPPRPPLQWIFFFFRHWSLYTVP